MPAPITTIRRDPGADPLIRQLIYQMAFTVWDWGGGSGRTRKRPARALAAVAWDIYRAERGYRPARAGAGRGRDVFACKRPTRAAEGHGWDDRALRYLTSE